MPYGATLADKLSKGSSLCVKAVLRPKALCKRKTNLIQYQRLQQIPFQIRQCLNHKSELIPPLRQRHSQSGPFIRAGLCYNKQEPYH